MDAGEIRARWTRPMDHSPDRWTWCHAHSLYIAPLNGEQPCCTVATLLAEVERLRAIIVGDGLNPDMPIPPGLSVEVERLRAALAQVRDYRLEPFDWPESEWSKHTPETCAECKRWRDMKHPIQAACDGFYRLLYSRKDRRESDEQGLHYRLRGIARDALSVDSERTASPSATPPKEPK